MYGKLLAGYVNPDTITNPVLGPKLQGFIGHFGDSPAAFFALFLPRLLTLALIIGAIIFFFVMIIGAIQWISSGGDKNALEEAKHKITNAVVGIIILFSLFAILKVIENFFGISILTLDIGPLVI
jgi:hypothetical protein